MNHFTYRITDFPGGDKSFIEIPVEVGADIERIEVSYVFPTGSEGSVIDIGLAHNGRMRGWTGSEYGHIWVSEDRASAGYHAGPLEGHWDVVFGVVRLGPDPWIDVSIRLIPRLPVWLAGELHSHTEHSDGGVEVTQALSRARNSGCDFLAMTDHNATSQNRIQPEDNGMLRIPGMELTTYWGHTNFLGLPSPVDDWRCYDMDDVATKMAEAKEKGATIVINHPRSTAGFNWWQPGFDVAFDALEIWNGNWAKHNVDAIALWQELLSSGRRIPATGGSDFHLKNRRRHGRPANRLCANGKTVAGILSAVRSGANVVCAAPDETMVTPIDDTPMFGTEVPAGTTIGLKFTGLADGDEIRLIDANGILQSITAHSSDQQIEQKVGSSFLRTEVWRGDQPRLFANPHYSA